MSDEILLPFKPFTFGEVSQMTGIPAKMIDQWAAGILRPYISSRTVGWDYNQTFAAFVGYKFLSEGSDVDRAASVVVYLNGIGLDVIEKNLLAGCNFPALYKDPLNGKPMGSLIPAPNSRLGQTLRLDKLLVEFRAGVARVFPNG